MKPSKPSPADKVAAPVFPQTLHRKRQAAAAAPKAAKRDNVFSQSRDIREDRGERQIKTKQNPQTFSRGKR